MQDTDKDTLESFDQPGVVPGVTPAPTPAPAADATTTPAPTPTAAPSTQNPTPTPASSSAPAAEAAATPSAPESVISTLAEHAVTTAASSLGVPDEVIQVATSTAATGLGAPPPPKKTLNPLTFFFWLLIAFLVLFAILIGAMIAGLSAADTVLVSFGLDPVNFKNWTIGLTHVFFGGIAITAFIRIVLKAAVVIFSKKDELFRRHQATKSIWLSSAVMLTTLAAWYGVYTYVQSFLVTEVNLPTEIIALDPETNREIPTLGMTSPLSLTFSAERITGEFAPTNDIIAYEWDKDSDGVIDATGERVQLYFQDGGRDNGVYKVMMTLRMQPKGKAEPEVRIFEKTISISNQTMYGEILSSVETGEAPLTVDLDAGTIAHPRGAPITNYRWDFNGDTQADLEGPGYRRVNYVLTKSGEQTIYLTVTARFEGRDETKQFEKKIFVRPSQALVSADATFSATPRTGVAPLPVILDASESGKATTTRITRYEWLINDGEEKLYGRTANYTFQKPGDYLVTLRAIYETGDVKVDSLTIRVAQAQFAPSALIRTTPAQNSQTGAVQGPSPFPVSFDATGTTDGDNNIVSYSWDFGDGTRINGANASHTYRTPGTYRARLTVTDADGLTSESLVQIIVDDELPLVSFGASQVSGTVPFSVNFDASGSRFAKKSIVSYEWLVVAPGEQEYRTVNERAQMTREFTEAGEYAVYLTLVAGDGSRTQERMVIVANPPALNAAITTSRLTGKAPLAISFSSSKSSGPIVRREWNFNDGTPTSNETAPQHIFQKPGTYSVVLRVFDSTGAVHASSVQVQVAE